ncbi:urease accessory protein [Cryobacterium psychrophilum]|uniref:Urease accessory protein n=2 Tax=Cryobacterium psychrophilum TaxID=41988 RepID=A0A4Y8KKG2_9MICO|nr:urease accessory protein [Cryobacterium psychrophilum]
MMLADARLPVGGHVHSAGLEPALASGMDPSLVPAYILGRARSVTLVEAGTAVVARHVSLGGETDDLAHVDRAWAARTPSAAVRDVSRSLARGYLRLALRLWPANAAIEACAGADVPFSRPVVVGVIAAAAHLDAPALVRLVAYDDAQTVAAAMLKLEPLDPIVPPGWVLDACAAVEEFVDTISALTIPDAIPALGAPESEGWVEAHSRSTKRLFRA